MTFSGLISADFLVGPVVPVVPVVDWAPVLRQYQTELSEWYDKARAELVDAQRSTQRQYGNRLLTVTLCPLRALSDLEERGQGQVQVACPPF